MARKGPPSAEITRLTTSLAIATRYRGPDAADVLELRRELKVAQATVFLRRLLDDGPALHPAQLDALRRLLTRTTEVAS